MVGGRRAWSVFRTLLFDAVETDTRAIPSLCRARAETFAVLSVQVGAALTSIPTGPLRVSQQVESRRFGKAPVFGADKLSSESYDSRRYIKIYHVPSRPASPYAARIYPTSHNDVFLNFCLDPDNEDIPTAPVGEGWVTAVLDEDIMGGVDFDDDDDYDDENVDIENAENSEKNADIMEGLKGGVDQGGGWVAFQLKDGEALEGGGEDGEDDDEGGLGLDDGMEDDMDARIRQVLHLSLRYCLCGTVYVHICLLVSAFVSCCPRADVCRYVTIIS